MPTHLTSSSCLRVLKSCRWLHQFHHISFSSCRPVIASLHTAMTTQTTPPPPRTGEEFKVFYRWPTIRHFRLLSRSKLYQAVFMSLLLPPATAAYQHGSLGGHTLAAAYVAAGGTLALLLTLSHLFTKVIGEMAYLPATHRVRISTLTFLGDRRDIVVDSQHILPVEDRGPLEGLEIVGRAGILRYSVRYGEITDTDIMEHVLLHRQH